MSVRDAFSWRRQRSNRRQQVEGPVDCVAVAKVVQSYLDGELEGDVESVGAHLDACRECGLEMATYNRIKLALARPHHEIVDPATIERLRAFGARLAADD